MENHGLGTMLNQALVSCSELPRLVAKLTEPHEERPRGDVRSVPQRRKLGGIIWLKADDIWLIYGL
jgi:hypothetical protein